MINMKRVLSIVIIFLASFVYYRADGFVTIKVMSLPTEDTRTISGKASNEIVKRFCELHPDIKLESFSGISIPGMGMETEPLLAMAGGVAPDILYVNFRISESYISQGFLYPLDEYVEKWQKEDPEEFKKAIYPSIWPVIKREGHVWAIPYGGVLVMGLMYRKDLFREAGLDPDKPPKNWDELYEYCKKLTVPEKGQYGMVLASGLQEGAWHFINFLWSAGGEIIKEESPGNWKAVFNTPEAVTALEFYRKLVRGKWRKEGKEYQGVAYRATAFWMPWAQGKIGMMFNYLDEYVMAPGIDPNLIGIAPVPLGPTGLRGSEINSGLYGINATINKTKRDAAWEYIKFLNSKEGRYIKTRVYVENGWAKYIPPKYLREFGYDEYIREVPAGWEETLDEALRNGKPEPYGKNCELIYYELNPPVDAVTLSDTIDAKTLLDKAVARANEKLLGIIPEKEQKKRILIAEVVLGLIILIFAFVFYRVFKTFSNVYKPVLRTGGKIKTSIFSKKTKFAYLIMLPALISVLIWAYYPLIKGSIMAFQDYRILLPTKYVGVSNFSEVLFTPRFWKSLLNTMYYAVLFLGLGFFSPVILAIMLHEVPKCKVLYRTLYYLPAVTSGLVIIFLWRGFYDPSPAGLLNKLVSVFGINPQTWLNDPKLAMLCVILPIVWANLGPGCIIYLAALKSIPEELYEAASIDGAGIWHKVKHIILSQLKPLLIINFVGAFIAAMRSFDFIFAMTGGGPLQSTHVVGLEIWYNAFLYLKFGYAVAMAWLIGSLLVGFTVYNLKILSRVQFKTVR